MLFSSQMVSLDCGHRVEIKCLQKFPDLAWASLSSVVFVILGVSLFVLSAGLSCPPPPPPPLLHWRGCGCWTTFFVPTTWIMGGRQSNYFSMGGGQSKTHVTGLSNEMVQKNSHCFDSPAVAMTPCTKQILEKPDPPHECMLYKGLTRLVSWCICICCVLVSAVSLVCLLSYCMSTLSWCTVNGEIFVQKNNSVVKNLCQLTFVVH